MFRNRAVLVKLSKTKNNEVVDETVDARPIEVKADAILQSLKKVGWQAFGCVCVYVLLDTFRQVAVARAEQPYPTDE